MTQRYKYVYKPPTPYTDNIQTTEEINTDFVTTSTLRALDDGTNVRSNHNSQMSNQQNTYYAYAHPNGAMASDNAAANDSYDENAAAAIDSDANNAPPIILSPNNHNTLCYNYNSPLPSVCTYTKNSEVSSSSDNVTYQATSNSAHSNDRSDVLIAIDEIYEQHNDNQLRMLQWNIRGFDGNSANLINTMDIYKYGIVLLQEIRTKYDGLRHVWTPTQLQGFRFIHDKLFKTGMYINDKIKFTEIPLSLITTQGPNCREHLDTLYATATIIETKIQGIDKNIAILNLYRSPNGKCDITNWQNYEKKIYSFGRKNNKRIDGVIVGGDTNCHHKDWGSRKSKKEGRLLTNSITDRGYAIINDGTPTRYELRSHRRTIIETTPDQTWTKGLNSDTVAWTSTQLPTGSDHYQIKIVIKCTAQNDEEYGPPSTHYKLTDDETKWNDFGDLLRLNWQMELNTINHMWKESTTPTQGKMDKLMTHITNVYHSTAEKIFKKTEHNGIWKRWITTKAQKASIAYHRLYRQLKEGRKLKRGKWKLLDKLKRARNKLFKQHKRDWISSKFGSDRLDGKDGWTIIQEVRNLNDTRGRSIPDLINKKGEICAQSATEKCKYMNEFYHRHNTNKLLDAEFIWTDENIIDIPNYQTTDYSEVRTDHIPLNDTTANTNIRQDLHCNDDSPDYITDAGDLDIHRMHTKFAHWIQDRTHQKWNRCYQTHPYYLDMINAEFTEQEIHRSIQSFSNNKSSGPDQLHIKFFKKCNQSKEILHFLFTKIYQTFTWPTQLKQRWISLIIKSGKTGNEPKHLRPVSLTSYVGKILEKMMVYRLVSYITRLKLLSNVHFAYMRNRGTEECILYITDQIKRNFRKYITTHGIFFDFSSAFDCTQYNVLIWKLRHEFFLDGPFIEILANFLKDRTGAVKINKILYVRMD